MQTAYTLPTAALPTATLPAAQLLPARETRTARDTGRMLLVNPTLQTFQDRSLVELPEILNPGDLLIMNDAATLPASLAARVHGQDIELRLLSQTSEARWWVVALGAGDWRIDTALRGAPPAIHMGDRVTLGPLSAQVVGVSPITARLVEIIFDSRGVALWDALYAQGTPIQYSYQREALALWSVQTSYASRPWAVEMPSAGHPLSFRLLRNLRLRGVQLSTLTHAAGLSATGDPTLDRALPLPERYDIPQSTVEAVGAARARGARVVAVGTSVVRALEGSFRDHGGRLTSGSAITSLRIVAGTKLSLIDGLLSGVHAPGESHFDLLQAFADEALWRRALQHAASAGYLAHEFGDSTLVLPSRLAAR